MNDSISHRGPDDEGYFELLNKENKKYYFGNSTPKKIIENESIDKVFNHIDSSDKEETSEISKIIFGHRRLSIIDLSNNLKVSIPSYNLSPIVKVSISEVVSLKKLIFLNSDLLIFLDN